MFLGSGPRPTSSRLVRRCFGSLSWTHHGPIMPSQETGHFLRFDDRLQLHREDWESCVRKPGTCSRLEKRPVMTGDAESSGIGKMVGENPLEWGPLTNQPHVHIIYSGYLLGISPFNGLQQGG